MKTQAQSASLNLSILKTVLKVAAGVALLIAASKMSVQIGPVPLTMQTCAIGLIGAWMGSRLGFITTLTFVLAGLCGLPIFATPLSGLSALAGPTGGYLIAFPFAAAMVGFLAERGWTGTRIVPSFIAQFIGNIFIVAFGGLWLMTIAGVETAFAAGLIPFVLPALMKSVLATALLAGIKVTFGK